jgi:hypothetical protein
MNNCGLGSCSPLSGNIHIGLTSPSNGFQGYVLLRNVALYKVLETSIKVKFTLKQATKSLRGNRGPMIDVYVRVCLEAAFGHV